MSKSVVEITGFEELQRKIILLSNDKDKFREIRLILKREAESTVKAAKSIVRVSRRPHWGRSEKIYPGNLKSSIGTIIGRKGQSKINPTVYAGPRVKGSHDGWYGAMVEGGHNVYRKSFKRKSHKRGSTQRYASKAIGFVKPKPFMAPAYKMTKGLVGRNIEKKTARFIQRRINKLSS